MFACLATDYPRGPFAAQPDLVADAERRHAAGDLDDAGRRAVLDGLVREVIAEQERAGLALVTDGGVRWPDPLRPLIDGLDGLAAGEQIDAYERGLTVTRPLAVGTVAWRAPVYVAAYEFAAGCTGLPIKQAVCGPYTVGRLTGLDGDARKSVTLALAEALNVELRALVMAGCLMIQVEEDGLATVADDAERTLFREAHCRLTAELENPELVHLSLGVAGGSAAEAGAAVLFDAPYSSYFFDLLRGPRNWELVLQAPFDKGIVCGAARADAPGADEVESLAYAMTYAATANDRGSVRVGIAPSGSLRGMERHYARRKMERLAFSLGVAGVGPLVEVAQSLEPNPTGTARYPELRALARSYQAARAAVGLPIEWRPAMPDRDQH